MTQQDEDDEDLIFNVEEVQKIVRDNIELCLGGNIYSHSRTPQWITIITEKTMARLHKLNKPFKYLRLNNMEQRRDRMCPLRRSLLELTAGLGNVVIFAKSKYEPDAKILKTLKFIQVFFRKIEIMHRLRNHEIKNAIAIAGAHFD